MPIGSPSMLAVAGTQLSTTSLDVVALVMGVVFAVVAVALVNSFRTRFGVTPWRMPAVLWALIGFFLGLIGMLLLAIAWRTTPGVDRRRRGLYGAPGAGAAPYGQYPGGSYGGYGGYGGYPPGAGYPPPSGGYGSYPPGAGYPPPSGSYGSYPPPSGVVPPSSGPAGGTSPPRPPEARPDWYEDPSGRHQLRYFDGTSWTEHVADQGVTSIDEDGTPR